MFTRWLGVPLAVLVALVAAGALASGCGGTAQADHAHQARPSAASRNKLACEYVLVTFSPLAQRVPKGYRTADLPRIVAGAASPVLRQELSAMQAAAASKNFAEVPQAASEMVETCDQLGFSDVDRN